MTCDTASGLSTTPRKGSTYLANGLWIEPLPDCPDDAYDPTHDPDGYATDVQVLFASGLLCEERSDGVLVGNVFLLVRGTRTWTAPGTRWRGTYGYGEVGDLIRVARAFGEGGNGVICSSGPSRAVGPSKDKATDGGGSHGSPGARHPGSIHSPGRIAPDYSRFRRYAGGEAVLNALGLETVDDLVQAVNDHRSRIGRYPIQTGDFPTSKRLFVRLTTEYAAYRLRSATAAQT